MKIGDKVKVYDGELIGWTTAILIKDLGNNRWQIKTKEGYYLNRFVKEGEEPREDGYGYYV